MYAFDFDDRLPPASFWAVAIIPYTKNPRLFECPSRMDQAQGYAFNSRLSGAKVKSIKSPGRVPILFETTIDQANAADPLISFALPHDGSSNVTWLDGHVTAVKIAPGSYGE